MAELTEHQENEWFAVCDGFLYHLGNYGDYEAADIAACDYLDAEYTLILSGETALQWLVTLQEGLQL